MFLEGGRRYYLEAVMQEGGGGDNLAVRWQLPGGTLEEPLPANSPRGTRLIPYDGVDTRPGIYQQSTNTTVTEGQNVRFSVLVTNRSAVAYQWRLGTANIAGTNATKPFYAISNVTVAAHNGQVYRCVVTNAAGSITSAPITLTVIADTVRPTVTRVLNVGVYSVQVIYSEPVEASSATNLSNYVLTNGLGLTRAVLSADNASVTLSTATPLVYGSNYTLVINRVRDRASSPNTILTNTTVAFTAMPYATQDIGGPPFPSSLTLVSGGLDVVGSGADIGGYSDQFGFAFTIRTGDFDIAGRLAGLGLSDIWAKAGLMIRESMEPGSRFAATLTTPAINGCFFEWRDPASAAANSAGNFPANYPYTWLRLKRVGNTFLGFAGYDGLNWAPLGSATMVLPSQLYFGLAVSSHNAGQPTLAQFRDMMNVTNAIVGSSPVRTNCRGPRAARPRWSCPNHVPARFSSRHEQSRVPGALQLEPLVREPRRAPPRGRQHELYVSSRDNSSRRSLPGGGSSPGEHSERLWNHQCVRPLHGDIDGPGYAPID